MKILEFKKTSYPSDLTDTEWEAIEPLIPVGNKSAWHKRSLVNAVCYLEKTGCNWRYIPRDYPPYDTVWSFFRRACKSGLWERIKNALARVNKIKKGRKRTRVYGIVNSKHAKIVIVNEKHVYNSSEKLRNC